MPFSIPLPKSYNETYLVTQSTTIIKMSNVAATKPKPHQHGFYTSLHQLPIEYKINLSRF